MATQEDKTNTGVVATVVVVGAIAMVSVSSMLAAMVRQETSELDSARPEHADLETVRRLRAEQHAALSAPPQWKDRAAERVTMPLERAKQLVLAQYQEDPASASPEPPPGLIMNPAAPGAPGAAVPGMVTPPASGASAGSEVPASAGMDTTAEEGTTEQATEKGSSAGASEGTTPGSTGVREVGATEPVGGAPK